MTERLSKIKFLSTPEKRADFWKLIRVLMLILVIASFAGFIYEELFYRIDLGYWDKRGSCFGPWVIIYGEGAILILGSTYKFRKKWYLMVPVAMLVTGGLEFISGWFFYTFQGIRYWDYNTEIWNWGNIGGFVCARSVLMFGFMAVVLQYVVRPLVYKLANSVSNRAFTIISLVTFGVFVLDHVLYKFLNPIYSFWGH